MANFNSTLVAGKAAKSDPSTLGAEKSTLFSAYAHYTPDASENVGDTLTMFTLPDNAILMDMVLTCDGFGANIDLQIGDSGDDDRYMTAQTFNSGSSKSMISILPAMAGYRLTSDTTIVIKFSGADMSTAGSLNPIRLYCSYVMPGATQSPRDYI